MPLYFERACCGYRDLNVIVAFMEGDSRGVLCEMQLIFMPWKWHTMEQHDAFQHVFLADGIPQLFLSYLRDKHLHQSPCAWISVLCSNAAERHLRKTLTAADGCVSQHSFADC